jgi:hypothetical protein
LKNGEFKEAQRVREVNLERNKMRQRQWLEIVAGKGNINRVEIMREKLVTPFCAFEMYSGRPGDMNQALSLQHACQIQPARYHETIIRKRIMDIFAILL